MEIAELQLRQNIVSAMIRSLNNPHLYSEVKELKFIGNGLYYVELNVNQQYLIRCLAVDRIGDVTLFLEANAIRVLVFGPLEQDFKNAIKDYHSIGHQ